ncbi:MAG: cbb3-type cytochrome oxidase assembly protein CcoS [Bacteroidota bacterium]
MSIIYLLLGCSLLMALVFLGAFIWSVRSGQLDDDYTPSVRILFDDIKKKDESSNEKVKNEKTD